MEAPPSSGSRAGFREEDGIVISVDRTWGEALVRFQSETNPETGLDSDQVDYFRRRLLGSLDEIAERIAALKAVRPARSSSQSDAVHSILTERIAENRSEIEAVSSALVAVDAGVYGICLRCRRPVGFELLSMQPTARVCSPCADPPQRSSAGPSEERSR